ncbi:DNA-3-methyladenine glycosylase family protein [Phycicoccus avicenniae]|uniref:DNA-3-methyladenine glycosylase family protein n=1 Tax=Phycicoccus avicenniae TaxID=2828860 RepID=UPI003D2CBC00
MPVVEEEVHEPLDVPALRAWLVAHAVPGVDEVVVGADGGSGHVRALPDGSRLEVLLPAVGVPVLRSTGGASGAEVARRWLGLDLDPAPGVAALADDPVLGPLVTSRPLVRVPGAPDPFEAAVNVVLGQHVSLAAGRVFAGRLAAAHPVNAEALAVLDPEVLRASVGVTGARSASLVALARAVLDGLDLDPQVDPSERAATRAALLALPGVGPWTADLVAMRCLRDPDVFLPGDLVLRKALGGVTAREAARLAEAWAPHRSLAVVHLWTHHALDPPDPTG